MNFGLKLYVIIAFYSKIKFLNILLEKRRCCLPSIGIKSNYTEYKIIKRCCISLQLLKRNIFGYCYSKNVEI